MSGSGEKASIQLILRGDGGGGGGDGGDDDAALERPRLNQ
jgi:hypothetical protein